MHDGSIFLGEWTAEERAGILQFGVLLAYRSEVTGVWCFCLNAFVFALSVLSTYPELRISGPGWSRIVDALSSPPDGWRPVGVAWGQGALVP